MERGIQIKGTNDPDPRMFDTDAVLVSQEEIEEQLGQVRNSRRGGCTHIVRGRSRKTIDPSTPTLAERSTSGFHRPGRYCLHQARSAGGALGITLTFFFLSVFWLK